MNECESFRDDLDAFRDELLDEERSLQLHRHIKSCSACTAEIKQAEAIEAEIRGNAAQWQPPENLWGRIQNTVNELESETTIQRKTRRKPLSWAVAAMLVVALILGINFNRQADSSSVGSVLVNEFHTFSVSRRDLDYVNSEPLAIRQWFGDKVDFRVPLPVNVDGLNLVGGRLCNMLNQRVASYMYRSDGAWVSLYIMKAGQSIQRDTNQHLSLQGYGYIEWENEGLHYSLVGDISIEQLHQIANSIYTRQLSSPAIQSSLPVKVFRQSNFSRVS